ncbi:hypothetical protein EHYA_05552 [Embleya hyalina]|uniref:Uncharacterized protein n=1 Tax=Embleya hyalina TaxID=516124 RepID=A0A401YTH6_9ACTN|nr:hypothetical protein EHYA_05552 [Embleya hyalina]
MRTGSARDTAIRGLGPRRVRVRTLPLADREQARASSPGYTVGRPVPCVGAPFGGMAGRRRAGVRRGAPCSPRSAVGRCRCRGRPTRRTRSTTPVPRTREDRPSRWPWPGPATRTGSWTRCAAPRASPGRTRSPPIPPGRRSSCSPRPCPGSPTTSHVAARPRWAGRRTRRPARRSWTARGRVRARHRSRRSAAGDLRARRDADVARRPVRGELQRQCLADQRRAPAGRLREGVRRHRRAALAAHARRDRGRLRRGRPGRAARRGSPRNRRGASTSSWSATIGVCRSRAGRASWGCGTSSRPTGRRPAAATRTSRPVRRTSRPSAGTTALPRRTDPVGILPVREPPIRTPRRPDPAVLPRTMGEFPILRAGHPGLTRATGDHAARVRASMGRRPRHGSRIARRDGAGCDLRGSAGRGPPGSPALSATVNGRGSAHTAPTRAAGGECP